MLMPIFPWQRSQMVAGNMPTLTGLWLTLRVGYYLWQGLWPRQVTIEHAECILSIVHHTNAEQRYHWWGQLTHFYHTIVRRGPPLSFPEVTCCTFSLWTCENHGNVRKHEMDVFTKFDGPGSYHFWSTSLKAPFLYTCNTVVLYIRLN